MSYDHLLLDMEKEWFVKQQKEMKQKISMNLTQKK